MRLFSTTTLAAAIALAAHAHLPSASAQDWMLPGGGDWHTVTSWNPQSIPDGIGAAAFFASVEEGGSLTGPCTPVFDSAITLGSLSVELHISNTPVYLNPPLLTMDNGGGADVYWTTDAAYNVQIACDVVLMGNLITDWSASNGQVSGTQTTVPVNWFPLIPVAVDPSARDVKLELGTIVRSPDEQVAAAPAGRILSPSALDGEPYRVDEEVVPRTGLLVSRTAYRARWIDGSTHVWVARKVDRSMHRARVAPRM